MIQIYKPDNTNFDKNGDMTLMPSKAIVHTVLNGTWTAELSHPIDAGGRWKYIEDEAVVKMPSFNGDQLFRIRKKEKSDSQITASLEPIFMDAKDDCFLVDVRLTMKNGQEALDIMTAANNKYSASSDIPWVSVAHYEYMNLIEAINGDDENSFINRWGGEILFDNHTVIINKRVGGDYGVELRYGKNIKADGLTEEIDTRNVVTRIYPKGYDGVTMSNHGYVDSPLINNYPTVKSATITFDNVRMKDTTKEEENLKQLGELQVKLVANGVKERTLRRKHQLNKVKEADYEKQLDEILTERNEIKKEIEDLKAKGEEEEQEARDEAIENGWTICETQEELDNALIQECNKQFDLGLDEPIITIDADMVLLQNTDLYKDYAVLEEVSPGDTIHCRHCKLDINTDARVIEMEYDCIKKKVTSVTLGDFEKQTNYFDDVQSAIDKIDSINEAIRSDGSIVAEKIKGFINGAMTSLRAQYNVAKKQDVMAILFENLDESSEMYGALAIGTQGLVISKRRTSDGKDWDWTTAITAAGMIADTIVAGLLSDQTGRNYWNLNTGELVAGNASFKNYSGDDAVEITNATMKITNNKKDTGRIGSNNLSGNKDVTGLTFEQNDGDYMFWGIRNGSGTGYTPIMVYTKGKYTGLTGNALNILCNIDMKGNKISNANIDGGYSGTIPFVRKIIATSDGKLTKVDNAGIVIKNGIITSVQD